MPVCLCVCVSLYAYLKRTSPQENNSHTHSTLGWGGGTKEKHHPFYFITAKGEVSDPSRPYGWGSDFSFLLLWRSSRIGIR